MGGENPKSEIRNPKSELPFSIFHPPKLKATKAALLFIILLAAFLRLAELDLVEFKYDEAHTLTVAAQVARGEALPRVSGETSWGVERPALSFYLYALPTAVGRRPALSVAFSALLGVLAVAGTYRLAVEFFDRPTALVAALLYAVNPWCILYERKVWAHPLPALSVLILYCAYRLVIKRRPWAALPLLLALGLQGQMHVLAWLYLPFAFLLLVFYRRRWRPQPGLLGAGAWALVTLPYAAYLWEHRAHVWSRLSERVLSQPARVDAAAVRQMLHLAGGSRLQELLGPEGALHFVPYRSWLTWDSYLLAVLLLAGMVYAAYGCFRARGGRDPLQGVRRRSPDRRLPMGRAAGQDTGTNRTAESFLRAKGERDRYALLLLWLVVPLVLLTRHSIKVQRQYLTLLVPGLFVLIALPLGWLLRRQRLGMALGATLLAFVAFTQGSSILAFYGYVDRYGAQGGFGVPLRYWQRAVDAARAVASAHGLSEIEVVTQGVDPVYEERPTLLAYLLRPDLDPRFLRGEESPALLLPWERELLYLTTVEEPNVLAVLRRWGREAATVAVPGGPTMRVWTLPARSAEEMAVWPARRLTVRFDNGARLWGVGLPEQVIAGGSVWLLTYWALDEVLPEQVTRMWSIFNHLLDEEGTRWGQGDGLGLPSFFWRPGDRFLQWNIIGVREEAPAGEYELLTGMYSLRDGIRASHLDAQGQPAGDAISLGAIRVLRGE